LLFSDVVGSTALKQALGDRAGVALVQEHHALVRNILEQFPGAEEISTAGDSFLLVFIKPSDAVRFALLLQARLGEFNRGRPVPVEDRIGLHLGEVVVEETGAGKRDVHGMQVDTGARVMGLAQARQILMTRPVFDNARQSLKGEEIEGISALDWLNHGRFELKGVGEPVEICEVRAAGVANLSPPTTSEKARRVEVAEGEAVLGWRPAVGTVVPNTKWVLEQKLGEGGFGEVWLGRHQVMKERRVFKFCFRADRVRSLKREMTLFRLIKERIGDHPNIVSLREVYFDEPPFYVEMDYVAGQDLRAWCETQGRADKVSLESKLEIVAQVADALQAAHDAGVIHRDVKPGNILVGGPKSEVGGPKPEAGGERPEVRGQRSEVGGQSSKLGDSQLSALTSALVVKLTDFGIGQVVSQEYLAGVTRAGFTQTLLSGSSSQTGTQLYLAPELLAGEPATTRSDIYSLGVVLYQLVVGAFNRPLTSDWTEEVGDPLLRDDLRHCVAGKPAERFVGAGQLAKNLRSLPERRAELERRAAEKAGLERAAYRRGVIRAASLAAGIVALLAALAMVALKQSQRAKAEAAKASKARDLAQGRLYAAQMKLAHAAFKDGKTGGALALLRARQPAPGEPDFRGFDWRYLYRLCLSSPSEVLATNASGYQSVDYSPDGRAVAFGTGDGFVELFEVQTRQRAKRWRAHAGATDHLAFYPRNNNWLATVSGDDGTLQLWDILGEHALFSTNVGRGVFAHFAFSPGGRFLATQATDAQSTDLWVVHAGSSGATPTLTLRTNLGFSGPAAFSPDERTLVVCNQTKGALAMNFASYDLVDGILTNLPVAHADLILAAAFSPAGGTLATGGGDERVVLWDVRTQKTLWTNRSDFIAVTSVAFTPDGQTLFTSGYDQTIRSWKVEDPTQVKAWPGHSAGVNRLAIAPDGRSFASASDDGTARLWTLPTAEFASAVPPQEEFTTLFPPQDTPSAEREQLIIFALAVSPAQDRAAAAENHRLILCDLGTGTVLTKVAATNIFPGKTPGFGGLTFSPDGRELAVGSEDGRVAFLDAVALRPLRASIKLHNSQITHIAYALNGSVLIAGGGFGNGINLTEVASGRMITNLSGVISLPLQPLAVSRDGLRLATGSPEGRVHVWDIAGRRVVASSPQTVRFLISMAFSPEGRLLAFGDHRGAIFLWDLSGQRPLPKLIGHAGEALTLTFSPDGRTLASAGMDHTIRLWHPEIDQEVAILKGHSEWVWCVAFGDHGNALLSGSRDGTLKLWRALSFEQIESQPAAQARGQ
jgi:WD40 repeat protein/serine/threonine protein kinase/class 3 adenylate cyclase